MIFEPTRAKSNCLVKAKRSKAYSMFLVCSTASQSTGNRCTVPWNGAFLLSRLRDRSCTVKHDTVRFTCRPRVRRQWWCNQHLFQTRATPSGCRTALRRLGVASRLGSQRLATAVSVPSTDDHHKIRRRGGAIAIRTTVLDKYCHDGD